MTDVVAAAKSYLGKTGVQVQACDDVERGAVRRFAQAIMDDDPAYADDAAAGRFGGAVAPPLFPAAMFRRPFGTSDPIQDNAGNPDYDGTPPPEMPGLEGIAELDHMAVLNGGAEIEFYQYARHGDAVTVTSRYSDIFEKQSSKGLMIFITIESEYRNSKGELLLITRLTQIRR